MTTNVNDFNFEEAFEKVKQSINKPNILICGATGVGKSSMVNHLFGRDIAKVGSGNPVTEEIDEYKSDDIDVVLYDSEGYEIGDTKQTRFKEKVLGFIDNKRKDNPQDIYKHIHLVWYCISAGNKRVTDLDKATIAELKNKNVAVAIILTQIDSVDEEELDDLKAELKGNALFTVSTDEDVPEEYQNWNDLKSWSLENLDDSLKQGFIISLKNDIESKKAYVNKTIIPRYVAAASAIALSPIPMSDSALLIPEQTAMCMHIMKVYNIDEIAEGVKSIISSTVISQVGKTVASTLAGNIAKFIPGFGTAIGGAINAGVAGSITGALGYGISQLCCEYVTNIYNGKPLPISGVFTPANIKEAISMFKTK